MNNHILGAAQGFDGPLDQILACLDEHLDSNIIRNPIFFDETPVKFELGIGRGRKSNFDFFKPTSDQRLKHLQFLRDIHGYG